MMDCYADVPYEKTWAYEVEQNRKKAQAKHEYANRSEKNKDLEGLLTEIKDVYSTAFTDDLLIAVKKVYRRLSEKKYKVVVDDCMIGYFGYEGKTYCHSCQGVKVQNYSGSLEDTLYDYLTKDVDKENQIIVLYLITHAFLVSPQSDLSLKTYVVFSDVVNIDTNKEESKKKKTVKKKKTAPTANNTCCFCGKELTDNGHDIRPLVTSKGSRCCEECNTLIVVPNRILQWQDEKGNSD